MGEPTDKKEPTKEEQIQEFERLVGLFYASLNIQDGSAEEKKKGIEKLQKISDFGKELKSHGISPEKLLFWHMLIGSGFSSVLSEAEVAAMDLDEDNKVKEFTVTLTSNN